MAINLSNNALRVLTARYLRRDAERHVLETPEDMFARVADAIPRAEAVFGQPNLRKCSILDAARRRITMITRPDVISMSTKCEA
jgi:hypothetical protein